MERIEIKLSGVAEHEIEGLKDYLNINCWDWTTRQLN